MTQSERQAALRAAARAQREAAQALRAQVRADRMADRARTLAEKAEARRSAREETWDTQRDAKVSRGVARAMSESDRRTNQQVLGAVLLAIGGNWLLAEFGLFTFGWPGLFAVALMTLGMAMVGTAKAGRTKPMIALGILLTLGLGMSSGISSPVRGQSFGEQTHTPRNAAELRERYRLTVGELTLDLTEMDFPEGTKSVDARLGVGELHVLVPEGVAVDVNARIRGAGEIQLLGAEAEEGFSVDDTYVDEAFESAPSRLELDLTLRGVGEIIVERG